MPSHDDFHVIRTEDMACKLFPFPMEMEDGKRFLLNIGLPTPDASTMVVGLQDIESGHVYTVYFPMDLVFHMLQHLNDDFELMCLNAAKAEEN